MRRVVRCLRVALIAVLALVAAGATAIGAAVAEPTSARQADDDPPAGERPLVNDQHYGVQWGLEAIKVTSAWRVAIGSGTTIAVIDSGVDLDHEDLTDQLVPNGNVTCLDTGGDADRCQAGDDDDGRDDDGHGTHVAGIALAAANNKVGIAGVAPGAGLMAIRVLGEECLTGEARCQAQGLVDDVTAGIRFAADRGADVINLSLGDATQAVLGPAEQFQEALRYAWDQGAVPVVAAGNDSVLSGGFSDEPVLVVAATNRSGQAATYSNGVGDARWALTAPGGESDTEDTCSSNEPAGILSTYWSADSDGNEYRCLSGTSMAVPHVAGAVSLLRSLGLSPAETVERLLDSARDLGFPGPDRTYGAGALDLAKAVSGLASVTSTTVPTPTTVPGGAGGPVPTTPDGSIIEGLRPTPTTTRSSPTTTPLAPTTAAPAAPQSELAIQAARPGDDKLPRWAVSVAVLMVIGVGTAHAWVLIQGAGWARRTPTGGGEGDT